MTQRAPDHVERFLREAGCREREIAKCTMETRLHHDLRLYGDEALDYLEVLAKEFKVDLSGFDFDRYFPREFPGDSFLERELFSICRWLYKLKRKRGYEPITLAMVDEAITKKTWQW